MKKIPNGLSSITFWRMGVVEIYHQDYIIDGTDYNFNISLPCMYSKTLSSFANDAQYE